MKIKNIALSFLLSLSAASASAAVLEVAEYPTNLKYENKPIDPLCFFDLESTIENVDLKTCGTVNNKYVVVSQDADLLKKGYYGFEWKDPTSPDPITGYSYYKAWDAGDNQFWLYTINNGGGSGDFTAINLYSRKDEKTAILKTIDSGDRCNGGIQDVSEAEHGVEYSVNLTAYDFLAIAKDNPHHLKAYDDLAACAACCAAKAYYTVDKTLKPKLSYIDLGANDKVSEMSEQGAYQACFNKLFSSYVSKGKTKLDQTELKKFTAEFNKTCAKG